MTEAARTLADRFESGEYGVGSYWGGEFCRNDYATKEVVTVLRAHPAGTQDREAIAAGILWKLLTFVRAGNVQKGEPSFWFADGAEAFLAAALLMAPIPERDGMREALKAELQISSDHDHRSWLDIQEAFKHIARATLAPPEERANAPLIIDPADRETPP